LAAVNQSPLDGSQLDSTTAASAQVLNITKVEKQTKRARVIMEDPTLLRVSNHASLSRVL
jgi:hypothetical protein